MNLPGMLMGVAAGIGIHAALTHGLAGSSRRPRDAAQITFAAAALSAAVAALAIFAMYSAASLDVYVAIAKWAFFPASVAWTVATVWFVASFTRVRPLAFLTALSAAFLAVVVVDLVLPTGLLYDGTGRLVRVRVLGAWIATPSASTPHPLHYATHALTVLAFVYLCYAVYRVYRGRGEAKVGYLGLMTVLLAVATLLDTINEHSVGSSFTTLYLTQICFALVIVAVSLTLRRQSLRVEKELRMYRTQMDALVAERVADLDEARQRLSVETGERRATEEVLRRRVEELNTLHRMAQILAGRSSLAEAIDEATAAMARLFRARYARVRLLVEDDGDEEAPDRAATDGRAQTAAGTPASLSALDLAVSAQILNDGTLLAEDVSAWPGVPEELRRQAEADGIGQVLAEALAATSGPAAALIIARERSAGPFTAEERQLARTVGDSLGALIEIDGLYRRRTREAAADERQALARDLHDAVTQSIYSATLIAEALPAVYERDPAEGLHNLERLRRLVRAALAELRTLLFELRPAALDTAPLDALVERLGDALVGQTDVSVKVEMARDLDLPADVKIAFYRVTQEAFSNISRHARATVVTARVHAADGGVTLTVADDGRGFDPAAVPSGHMGLSIMRERVTRVGGTLAVESAPGSGTVVRASWLRPASDRRPVERMGS